MTPRTRLVSLRLATLVALCLAPVATRTAVAQPALEPKRTVAGAASPGCAVFGSSAPTVPARRDSAEVRRLTALGHEAAIVGDHRAARDVFSQAAQLDPNDPRLLYHLGRSHEELGETREALRQYCRSLALAPESSDAAEVRGRIERLAPAGPSAGQAERARLDFARGVGLLERRRWDEAVEAFTVVLRQSPTAAEAHFNRALAHAARGRKGEATQDFQRYLALRPGAPDASPVREQIALLGRQSWSPGAALAQGLVLPGLGQVYTARPAIGLAVLAVVGGAAYWGIRGETVEKEISFPNPLDPEVIFVDTISEFERPNFNVGVPVAAAIMAGAAFEAWRYARRAGAVARPRGTAARRADAVFGALAVTHRTVGFRLPLPRR